MVERLKEYRLTIALLLASLIPLQFILAPLTTSVTPLGIVNFQLARTWENTSSILYVWKSSDRLQTVTHSLLLDFLCILGYAYVLMRGCVWSQRELERLPEGRKWKSFSRIGPQVVWAPVAAGALDCLENGCLWYQLALYNRVVPSYAAAAMTLAFVAATLKFTLVGLSVVYISIAFFSSPLFGIWREKLNYFADVVRITRFSLAISLIAGLALLYVGQSQEALRVLAEDVLPSGGRASGYSAASDALFLRGAWIRVLIFYFSVVLVAMTSWISARFLTDLLYPGVQAQEDYQGTVLSLVPRFCGLAPVLLAAGACWKAAQPLTVPGTPKPMPDSLPEQRPLMLLAVVFFITTVALGYHYHARRVRIEKATANTPAPRAFSELDSGRQKRLVLSLLPGLLLALAVPCIGYRFVTAIGPAAILMLAFTTYLPLGTMLVFWYERTKVPFLTIISAAALFLSCTQLNDNHRVRLAATAPATSQSKSKTNSSGGAPAALELNALFHKWLLSRPDRDLYAGRPYPVFVVAAEGGGLRAAYEAGMTLAAMQDKYPSFVDHLFAMSGVSGGSMGVGVFAGLTSQYADGAACGAGQQDAQWWSRRMDNLLGHDYISPPLASMLFSESTQAAVPFPIGAFDRSRALEYRLEYAWQQQDQDPAVGRTGVRSGAVKGGCYAVDPQRNNPFKASLYDLGAASLAGVEGARGRPNVPLLFLNTTRVETGDRLVLSSVPIRHGQTQNLRYLNDENPRIDLPLSTAIFLSARFTYVTPAGSIPIYAPAPAGGGEPVVIDRKRYVDGGYYENSGVATLSDLIDEMVTVPRNAKRRGEARQPYIIVPIRIGFSYEPEAAGSIGAQNFRGLDEPLAPLRTLWNTRDARARTAVARLNQFGTDGPGSVSTPRASTAPAALDAAAAAPGATAKTAAPKTAAQIASKKASQMAEANAIIAPAPPLPAVPGAPVAKSRSGVGKALDCPFKIGEVPLPLGWLLAKRARDDLARQAGLNLGTHALRLDGYLLPPPQPPPSTGPRP